MQTKLWLLPCFSILLFWSFSANAAESGELSAEAEARREIPAGVGLDFQFVPARYPNYHWVGDRTTSDSGVGFHVGAEWIPFDERYGKLGFGVGLGLSVIKNINFDGTKATLTAIPLELTMSYRFDYMANQILVPFVKGTLGNTFVRQRGIDREWANFRGLSYGGGLELCLNLIDRRTAKHLQNSTGIHSTYLVAEYQHSDFLGTKQGPNLTRDEWRLGLRFEL